LLVNYCELKNLGAVHRLREIKGNRKLNETHVSKFNSLHMRRRSVVLSHVLFYTFPAFCLCQTLTDTAADTAFRNPEAQALQIFYGQAEVFLQSRQIELAIAVLENLNSRNPGFRDVPAKLAAARKELAARRISERADTEFAVGKLAYEIGDWASAIIAFEKALAVNPDHREAAAFLRLARERMSLDNKNKLAERYYNEAAEARARNELQTALDLFEKARSFNPQYQNVEQQLGEAREKLARINQEIEALYAQAAAFLTAKQWQEAITTLEKIQLQLPAYRDVVEKLTEAKAGQRADALLAEAESRRVKMYWIGGAMIALVTLPIISLLMFSPASRAHALVMRGNLQAAADIFENLLKSDPSRVQLYKEVAEIYYRLGRKDKRSMEVYKMVVQLNLPVKHRTEIKALVSQNFMGESDVNVERLRLPAPEKMRLRTMSWPEHLEAGLTAVEQFADKALESALARASLDLSHPVLLTQVIMPMMQEVGQRWSEGVFRVEHEHMASATIRNFLGTVIESYTPPAEAPVVVVTTPKGQMHELGALAAAIVAASEGWKVVFLGPNLPAEEIAASVKKVRAKAVALSLIFPEGNAEVDKELRRLRTFLGASVGMIVGGRAADSHAVTLSEIEAVRVNEVHDLISFRKILETVRLKY